MPGLIYPGAGQFSEEIKERVSPGLLRNLLENLFSIESAASIGGNVDVGIPNVGASAIANVVGLNKPNLTKVPQVIKNRYVSKVLRAIITNKWDDLTPFLSASVRKYGLEATQDLANTPAPLYEAYKLAGVDKTGFKFLRTLHGPMYDNAVRSVLMPK